jgi:hypothetical protein
MKYFKTFEDLHDSVITTFKTYLQDASKVLCVMKKMREDFAIIAYCLLLNTYRSELEIIYLRNYRLSEIKFPISPVKKTFKISKEVIYLKVYIACFAVFMIFGFGIFFIFNESTINSLCREDGLYENLSAIFFLLSSIVFFITYIKTEGIELGFLRTKRNVFFLFAAIIFFIGFGEEISWGQRIIGFSTPAWLKAINVQSEFNFHNILSGERSPLSSKKPGVDMFFNLFWFCYGLVLPVLNRFSNMAKRFIEKLKFPVIPLYLGCFFLIIYLTAKLIRLIYSADLVINDNSIDEVKENMYAFIFFQISIYLYVHFAHSKNKNGNT